MSVTTRMFLNVVGIIVVGFLSPMLFAETASGSGCLSCHEGIEDIREANSGMMLQIKAMGAAVGDTAGCVMCHGGNLKQPL